jgi:hypothetical protein
VNLRLLRRGMDEWHLRQCGRPLNRAVWPMKLDRERLRSGLVGREKRTEDEASPGNLERVLDGQEKTSEMGVQFDEAVNELVEVLLALVASDVAVFAVHRLPTPRTEPASGAASSLSVAAPHYENFREPVVHHPAQLHVGGNALVRRPRMGVRERHHLAALRAEHERIVRHVDGALNGFPGGSISAPRRELLATGHGTLVSFGKYLRTPLAELAGALDSGAPAIAPPPERPRTADARAGGVGERPRGSGARAR